MENEKAIEVLNKLVEINNDRIAGYEMAAKKINEEDLKSLFIQFAQTSLSCREELSNEIYKLGGIPTEGTKNTVHYFRAWMDEKADLEADDYVTILNSCKFDEKQAINTYKNVLTEDLKYLRLTQQSMIRNQYSLIQCRHNTVKLMRQVLV